MPATLGTSSYASTTRFSARSAGPVLAVLLLLGLTGNAWAQHTYTLRPAADAMANQALPNNNYGSTTSLPIRHTATGNGQFSFLRFDIPALAGSVTSATLTLRVTGSIQEVGSYSVAMGNPTWAESWLTWSNWQIGTTYTYLGSQYNLSPGSNLNVNVAGWFSPSSPATFAVASGFDVTGQSFSSKEGSVDPVLTIVTGSNLAACTGPGQLLAELNSIAQTGNLLYACDYKKSLSWNFGSWSGGSENLPVIAAAVALFDGPVVNGNDYRTWWQSFFAQQAATSGSGHINYFKGSELFSNVYDAATTIGVMGARYWASPVVANHTTIHNLAGQYLTRTWYAYALSASSQPFSNIYRNVGSTRTWIIGQEGQCPTLAMASPRSKMYYGQDSKRWLTAKILGYNQTCYKLPDHKPVVDFMVSRYSGVSGLTSSQVTALRALINNTTIPSDLATVLGAVRMERDFHWLLWSDGRRATYYLGHQLNNNINVSGGKHTVFTAIFSSSNRDLDLLFAEGKNNHSCLESSTRRIHIGTFSPGCTSTHWITLPPDNPTYHYVLGPSGFRVCSTLAC